MEKLLWGFSLITMLAMSIVFLKNSESVINLIIGAVFLLAFVFFCFTFWRAKKAKESQIEDDKEP